MMTVSEFEAARERGEVPRITAMCWSDLHNKCKGVVVNAEWKRETCVCECHDTIAEAMADAALGGDCLACDAWVETPRTVCPSCYLDGWRVVLRPDHTGKMAPTAISPPESELRQKAMKATAGSRLDVVRSRHTSRIHLAPINADALCGRLVAFDERLTYGDIAETHDYATCGACLVALQSDDQEAERG